MPSARKRIQQRPCQEEFAQVQNHSKGGSWLLLHASLSKILECPASTKISTRAIFFLKPACNLRQWPNRHLSCSQPAHSSAFFDKSWWQGMPIIWNCPFSTFVGLACKKLTPDVNSFPFQLWKNGGALQCSTFFSNRDVSTRALLRNATTPCGSSSSSDFPASPQIMPR